MTAEWIKRFLEINGRVTHNNVALLSEIYALETGTPVFTKSVVGMGDIKKIDNALFKCGGKCVINSKWERTYLWDHGSVYLSSNTYGNCNISIYSFQKDLFDVLIEAVDKIVATPKSSAGQLFAMTQGMGGAINLSNVGDCSGNPLIDINYSKDVLEGYNHISACLNSKDPCGRIAILDGPPGTGKSYLIRALTNDVEAMFVLVSSTMIGQLSGPTLLPSLLNARDYRNDDTPMPIVLILEDADSVLVRREQGDRTGLAELLNLGDGLLGELADIRIIATTNADIKEMDPAVTRSGRLCRRIHAHELELEEANVIYRSLMNDDKVSYPEGMGLTLADIYRNARADGWVPDKKKSEVGGNYI